MAGCSIVFIMLIIMPILMIALAIFLGAFAGSVLALFMSVITMIVLHKAGFFEKFSRAEETWKKILAIIIRLILIAMIAGSLVMVIAGTVITGKIFG